VVLGLTVHVTLDTANWVSHTTQAPLSFQINQTWTALPPYVLVCTAKPRVKDAQQQEQKLAASTPGKLPAW